MDYQLHLATEALTQGIVLLCSTYVSASALDTIHNDLHTTANYPTQ